MQAFGRERRIHRAVERALQEADPDEGLPLASEPTPSALRGVLQTVGIIGMVVAAGVAYRAVLAAW